METFIIKPLLGLKSSVPQNDPTLFQMVSENVALTHCVDGLNFDLQRYRNSAGKSVGRTLWSNSAVGASSTRVDTADNDRVDRDDDTRITRTADISTLGLFYLDDGTNVARWHFGAMGASGGGHAYRYDGSDDPVLVDDAGSTDFASDTSDLYSIIRFGDYMVFTDFGEHTPYCSDYNDANIIKLISAGTEFKFRYLESFRGRILGAYSDQTNGDLDLRWSGALPVPGTSCEFTAASQLYKPDDDPIVGIKRLGNNACFLYGENSIDRIDYYANYTTPFGLTNVKYGEGAVNHHSIVNTGNHNFFYNRNLGFCMFDGINITPISDNIEDKIATIDREYATGIVGAYIPNIDKVAWSVPLNSATTNSHILYYNVTNGNWEIEDKVAFYLDRWIIGSGSGRTEELVWGQADGQVYRRSGDDDNGNDLDGYRIEPIVDFGDPDSKDLLLEIWFDLDVVGDYSLYCSHRSGNTSGEVEAASWQALTELSMNSPAVPVVRLAETAKLHQIMWGTDAKDEPFSVPTIRFRYIRQGPY